MGHFEICRTFVGVVYLHTHAFSPRHDTMVVYLLATNTNVSLFATICSCHLEGNLGSLGPSSSQNSFPTVGFLVCSAQDTPSKGGSLRKTVGSLKRSLAKDNINKGGLLWGTVGSLDCLFGGILFFFCKLDRLVFLTLGFVSAVFPFFAFAFAFAFVFCFCFCVCFASQVKTINQFFFCDKPTPTTPCSSNNSP